MKLPGHLEGLKAGDVVRVVKQYAGVAGLRLQTHAEVVTLDKRLIHVKYSDGTEAGVPPEALRRGSYDKAADLKLAQAYGVMQRAQHTAALAEAARLRDVQAAGELVVEAARRGASLHFDPSRSADAMTIRIVHARISRDGEHLVEGVSIDAAAREAMLALKQLLPKKDR